MLPLATRSKHQMCTVSLHNASWADPLTDNPNGWDHSFHRKSGAAFLNSGMTSFKSLFCFKMSVSYGYDFLYGSSLKMVASPYSVSVVFHAAISMPWSILYCGYSTIQGAFCTTHFPVRFNDNCTTLQSVQMIEILWPWRKYAVEWKAITKCMQLKPAEFTLPRPTLVVVPSKILEKWVVGDAQWALLNELKACFCTYHKALYRIWHWKGIKKLVKIYLRNRGCHIHE